MHHISETIRAGKLKFYIHLGGSNTHFGVWKFFARGRQRGTAPHSVNSGFPHISETVRAINLRFYAHLDGSSTLFGYEFFSVSESSRDIKGIVFSASSVRLKTTAWHIWPRFRFWASVSTLAAVGSLDTLCYYCSYCYVLNMMNFWKSSRAWCRPWAVVYPCLSCCTLHGWALWSSLICTHTDGPDLILNLHWSFSYL